MTRLWAVLGTIPLLTLGVGAGRLVAEEDFEYPASGRVMAKVTVCGSKHYHGALDIGGACGKCVYAAAPGRARYFGGCGKLCTSDRGCHGGAGNFIRMTHRGGYGTRYLHLMDGKGGRKSDSAYIGRMGATGKADSAHVHFEIDRYRVRMTGWLYSVKPCGSSVRAGRDIKENYAGIKEARGKKSHGPHGCK